MLPSLGPTSIRTFIGAKDFVVSSAFYKDIGFEESKISGTMSVFHMSGLRFYLQDYYVKDWIENTMVLLEVPDAVAWWAYLQSLQLDKKYPDVKLIPVREEDWGRECMLIDPAGVLWHFATFK